MEWKKVGGQEKKEIHYCFDNFTFGEYDKQGKWKGWIEEAVKEWNDANTGWKFTKVEENDPKCQVKIELNPELMYLKYDETTRTHKLHGKPGTVTFLDRDPVTKRLGKAKIELLPYRNEFYCSDHGEWEEHTTFLGTEGADKIDPRSIAKHELGHLLRIDHPPLRNGERVRKYMNEDVMWYNSGDMKGQHPRSLSAHDIEEAKESIKDENRGVAMQTGNITNAGGSLVYEDPESYPGGVKCIVDVPPGAVEGWTLLGLSILDGCIPPPRTVPVEIEIFSAIEVQVIEGETPNILNISIYYGDLPIGPEHPIGIYMDFPAIVEDGIRPFERVELGWIEISEYILGTSENMVQFAIDHIEAMDSTGKGARIFGLGGPLRPVMTIPEPPVGGLLIPTQKGGLGQPTHYIALGLALLALGLSMLKRKD